MEKPVCLKEYNRSGGRFFCGTTEGAYRDPGGQVIEKNVDICHTTL